MLRAARTGRLRMTWDEMRARIERQHEIWKRGDLNAIPGVDTVAFVAQMPKG